jgi:hypothetical protein
MAGMVCFGVGFVEMEGAEVCVDGHRTLVLKLEGQADHVGLVFAGESARLWLIDALTRMGATPLGDLVQIQKNGNVTIPDRGKH